MLETAVTALSPLACTDGASGGQMADDASALAESASGGGDCSSGEQQGTVLPFGHDPILICLTQGCNRRRRVVCDNGYASPRHLASHCCLDCSIRDTTHSLTCCELGPQPLQGIHGRLVHPVPSLATQRLIAPPEPMQTALLPQLEQEEEVGEAFFSAQRDSDNFIDDGDDDELPGTESGLRSSARMLRSESRDGATETWCELTTH